MSRKHGVKRMAQERLSIRPHMNGISYHCLLEKGLIFQILNLVLRQVYLNWLFWHPRLFIYMPTLAVKYFML